jgi:hypothetical protein
VPEDKSDFTLSTGSDTVQAGCSLNLERRNLMFRVTVAFLSLLLLGLAACEDPETDLECVVFEGIEACLPAENVQVKQELNRMYFPEEFGWIGLYSVVEDQQEAISDLRDASPSRDSRTIHYEVIDGSATHYYHLMLQDDGVDIYFEFAGIASLALVQDCGDIYGVTHVVFQGFALAEFANTFFSWNYFDFMEALTLQEILD